VRVLRFLLFPQRNVSYSLAQGGGYNPRCNIFSFLLVQQTLLHTGWSYNINQETWANKFTGLPHDFGGYFYQKNTPLLLRYLATMLLVVGAVKAFVLFSPMHCLHFFMFHWNLIDLLILGLEAGYFVWVVKRRVLQRHRKSVISYIFRQAPLAISNLKKWPHHESKSK